VDVSGDTDVGMVVYYLSGNIKLQDLLQVGKVQGKIKALL